MPAAPELSAQEAGREIARTEALVIGAGPAGLALGACLQLAAVPFLILERGDRVGPVWHRHYDRLHLHTPRSTSSLPHLPLPRSFPRYPSRAQVIAYLEEYAAHFGLAPLFREEVLSARRVDGGWEVRTAGGLYRARQLVIATGFSRVPVVPSWPGEGEFNGRILHSSEYRNARPFRGQRVLVVGFGNSAGEIALDLAENGAEAVMAVRGPVNVIPRDVLGIPIVRIGLLFRRLPPRLTDAVARRLGRLTVGDLSRYGLRRAPYGTMTQITRHARLPLIDIGTLALIRDGRIRVRGDLLRFTPSGVVFANGEAEDFDAVVLATGFRAAVDEFLEAPGTCDERGTPLSSGREALVPGLYFCGFRVTPGGTLREVAAEAPRIAATIAAKLSHGRASMPAGAFRKGPGAPRRAG